ncbi:hypothetical protein Areg01_87060 [Actinoplanes regularis]|nr:hypothetical protein Areg01_87060 [Actinoplanes regularis]
MAQGVHERQAEDRAQQQHRTSDTPDRWQASLGHGHHRIARRTGASPPGDHNQAATGGTTGLNPRLPKVNTPTPE